MGKTDGHCSTPGPEAGHLTLHCRISMKVIFPESPGHGTRVRSLVYPEAGNLIWPVPSRSKMVP